MMKKLFNILFVLLLLIWGLGFVLFAWYINAYQTNDDARTEAVVALTGGRNGGDKCLVSTNSMNIKA